MLAKPEDRLKKAEALLRRAEDGVRLLRADIERGNPDNLDQKIIRFEDLLKDCCFPAQRASEIRAKLRVIRCEAYEKSVDLLLHKIENASKIEDFKTRNELIGLTRTHLGVALRFGADEEFKKGVERRLAAALLTTAEGIDKRAKEAAERKAAEELKEKKTGPPHGQERRRCIRYVAPDLKVELDGRVYQTANWSVRGLLLETARDDLEPGDHVHLDLSCEGIEGGGRVTARVVDNDETARRLAFDFDGISTVVLGLMHGMRAAGIRPNAQR